MTLPLTFRFAQHSFDFLAVEPNRGHRVQVLIKFQPVESGSFPGRVQTQHHYVQCALARRQGVQ